MLDKLDNLDPSRPVIIHSAPALGFHERDKQGLVTLLSLLLKRSDACDDRTAALTNSYVYISRHEYAAQMFSDRALSSYKDKIIVTAKVVALDHPNVIDYNSLKGSKIEFTL